MKQKNLNSLLRVLSHNIKAYRHQLGWSQETLAERTAGGLSTNHVARIETGTRAPSLSVILRIANALGVDVADLFAERKEDKRDQLLHYVVMLLDGLCADDQEYVLGQLLGTVEYLRSKGEVCKEDGAQNG